MMTPKCLSVAAIALGSLVLAVPSFAHHSFAAEFDANNCADFTGTLTDIDWQNPHAYFHMDVKDAAGRVESWTFETVSLSTLRRSGTSRQEFLDNVGKAVSVRGCLARNGEKNLGAASFITMSDGVKRLVGQDVEGVRGGG